MPKLDLSAIAVKSGSSYPGKLAEPVAGRSTQMLGDAGGLTQFGVSITTLLPGTWASQRHWHEGEDEFVLILEGDLLLIDNEGEHLMRSGDAACFKAGDANGHHLVNRSDKNGTFLVVGTRNPSDRVHFPDIDLLETTTATGYVFTRKDGTST
jgi:uncharacterized cupin superfamily protein